MGLNLLRSMIMMTAMGGKNTLKNTAWEEARRRRTKESKRLFWGRRRHSRTYKLRPAIKPLLLVAADKCICLLMRWDNLENFNRNSAIKCA